jgi:hypothetical protein
MVSGSRAFSPAIGFPGRYADDPAGPQMNLKIVVKVASQASGRGVTIFLFR